MTTIEVGKKLVALVREDKVPEVLKTLYHPEIVSVEAGAPPGGSPEVQGVAACEAKGEEFRARHEVHGRRIEGPFPNVGRFAVYYAYDVTRKATGQRLTIEEVALYTVKDGRIVREEFFYEM